MKIARSISLLVLVILLTACSTKPKDAIIGKWKQVDGDIIIEYLTDGTAKMELAGQEGYITARYQFINDNIVQLTSDQFQESIIETVEISGDEMTTSSIDGKKTAKFHRQSKQSATTETQSSQPKDMILGKWELDTADEKSFIEFHEDGTTILSTQYLTGTKTAGDISRESKSIDAKYELVGDILTVTIPATPTNKEVTVFTAQVIVSSTELTMTFKGKSATYYRLP